MPTPTATPTRSSAQSTSAVRITRPSPVARRSICWISPNAAWAIPPGLSGLDVGCGVGLTDRFLVGRVGELHGVDTAEEAVARAAQR